MKKGELLILIIFLLFFPILSLSQDEYLKKVLPPEETFPNLKVKEKPQIYLPSNLYQYMNGEAEIYLEYGIDRYLVQIYSKNQEEIKVEIAIMKDSLSAYGIYSFYRSPDMKEINIGNASVISQYQLYFWQDRYYCKISASDMSERSIPLLKKIAHEISLRICVQGNLPEIIQLLPEKNRIRGSEKLIKGMYSLNNQYYLFKEDLFGFKSNISGAFAEYSGTMGQVKLFLLKYASNKEAFEAFSRSSQELKKRFLDYTQYQDDSSQINFLSGKTSEISLILKQRGNLLALVICTDEASGLKVLYELRW